MLFRSKPLHVAARAVVICDGGFQGNLPLIGRHITPAPEKVKQRGASTGVGDGLRMAQEAGAAITDLRCFYGHVLSRDAFTNDRIWPYPQLDELGCAGIAVDEKGLRFADEGRGGVFLANNIARLADPLTVHTVFDHAVWEGPGRNARIPANPNIVRVGAAMHQASSIAELAGRMGVPAAQLEQTVNEYNAALAAGRTGSLTPPRSTGPITGNLPIPTMPIVNPPFYAVPVCAGITYTMGGIFIDGQCRVVRRAGGVFEGLYAAGSCTGGHEGGPVAGYTGGLGKAMTFGWHAGNCIGERARELRPGALAA